MYPIISLSIHIRPPKYVSVCPSVRPPMHLCIHLPTHLPVYVSISISLCIYLSLTPPIHLYLSTYAFIHRSILPPAPSTLPSLQPTVSCTCVRNQRDLLWPMKHERSERFMLLLGRRLGGRILALPFTFSSVSCHISRVFLALWTWAQQVEDHYDLQTTLSLCIATILLQTCDLGMDQNFHTSHCHVWLFFSVAHPGCHKLMDTKWQIVFQMVMPVHFHSECLWSVCSLCFYLPGIVFLIY